MLRLDLSCSSITCSFAFLFFNTPRFLEIDKLTQNCLRRDVFGRLGSIQLQKYDTKLFPGQMGSLYMFLARFAVSYSVSDLRVHD